MLQNLFSSTTNVSCKPYFLLVRFRKIPRPDGEQDSYSPSAKRLFCNRIIPDFPSRTSHNYCLNMHNMMQGNDCIPWLLTQKGFDSVSGTKSVTCRSAPSGGRGRGRGRDGPAPAIDDASAFPTLGGKDSK